MTHDYGHGFVSTIACVASMYGPTYIELTNIFIVFALIGTLFELLRHTSLTQVDSIYAKIPWL